MDGQLKVYGIDNLRIADGSIMPRVTTGNTMAPCVIIGERAAEVLRSDHRLETTSVSHSSGLKRQLGVPESNSYMFKATYGGSR